MTVTETASTVKDTAAAPPLLELRNVEVVYNEVSLALRGISLSVPEPGAAVALLGANGAGKTTTMRAIAGLLDIHDGRIREGQVTLDGEVLSDDPPDAIVRRGVAQVPEGRKVFGHLTVEENLLVGTAAAAISRREVQSRLDQMYELFPPLADRKNAKGGYMSGGEQQMIAVGRALMAGPRLLLLDEVSLGLAPMILQSIIEQLKNVRDTFGTAMLMVEQNAQLALSFTDYAYVMENGRIVLDGPSEELKENEDVQEFYLGVSPDQEHKSFANVKHYKRRKRWVS